MKKLLASAVLLSFSIIATAQKPDWVSLDEVIDQFANQSGEDTSKLTYIYQRCAALQMTLSTLIEESEPELSNAYLELTSAFSKQAAMLRISSASDSSNESVERISSTILDVVTELNTLYLTWANNNYLMQGSYFEADDDFQSEIILCGEVAKTL